MCLFSLNLPDTRVLRWNEYCECFTDDKLYYAVALSCQVIRAVYVVNVLLL